MRYLMTFMLLTICTGTVFADNFYQMSNPFPVQTSSQQFNNIYATGPQEEVKEKFNAKKMKFWNKNNDNNTINVIKNEPVNNEKIQSTQDGSFYMFTAN